jgi:hypothetical protein
MDRNSQLLSEIADASDVRFIPNVFFRFIQALPAHCERKAFLGFSNIKGLSFTFLFGYFHPCQGMIKLVDPFRSS